MELLKFRSLYLVPKLGLGTSLPARLVLAPIIIPKYNLGTREREHSLHPLSPEGEGRVKVENP